MEALAAIATDPSLSHEVQYKAVTELGGLLLTRSQKIKAEEKAQQEKEESLLQQTVKQIEEDISVVGDTIYLKSNIELRSQPNESENQESPE